jgi:GR25 family glycosyltransferase involved in LPS biosynthesis
VNDASTLGAMARPLYRAMLAARRLSPSRACKAIGQSQLGESIERIYVINLNRHAERWDSMCGELTRLTDNAGIRALDLATRFPAVDSRQESATLTRASVRPSYFLRDQLFVEPHPLLEGRAGAEFLRVEMTRQEVAVALSHIAVWELVAASDCTYALVLEDDVFFTRGFGRALDKAWLDLAQRRSGLARFDVLYLSYKEAQTGARGFNVSDSVFKPHSGLWQLSGYVLSAPGARKLLGALPVCGPVDLWMNHQFRTIDVFATRRPIIKQRLDCQSANLHSILPVLTQVGVLTREKPLLIRSRPSRIPVFAFGEHGSDLTALAMALSMLGYRCCSDVADLPASEREKLFGKKRGRVFDAYVNIGSLTPAHYVELARTHRDARFIITEDTQPRCRSFHEKHDARDLGSLADQLRRLGRGVLKLDSTDPDKWGVLCNFLSCDHPSTEYPDCDDHGQRPLFKCARRSARVASKDLKWDPSPWVVSAKKWEGLVLAESTDGPAGGLAEHRFEGMNDSVWMLRDDTFPGNLALFAPHNFTVGINEIAQLTIREERTSVRKFTSAALCSRRRYLYGRFMAEVRAPDMPGLITGLFLHRNSPKQEIDIEFLGKDTRRMLVNVFYNPGIEGSKLEYGYRGTPTLVDLGFDASRDFHWYEIEWCPTSIRWRVDGEVVYERVNWEPTPVPHLPMQFNLNLWHSRSRELAGKLNVADLPATAELRALRIYSRPDAHEIEQAGRLFPVTGSLVRRTRVRSRASSGGSDEAAAYELLD